MDVPIGHRSAVMTAAMGIDQDLVNYLRATRWPCGLLDVPDSLLLALFHLVVQIAYSRPFG